mmetsp:Transcript_29077/g.78705  ORF Transcript_29077/g.78705 Transcript_29077/m.78705 type:complete len:105 (+) Transcript_29077:99-413(+)
MDYGNESIPTANTHRTCNPIANKHRLRTVHNEKQTRTPNTNSILRSDPIRFDSIQFDPIRFHAPGDPRCEELLTWIVSTPPLNSMQFCSTATRMDSGEEHSEIH